MRHDKPTGSSSVANGSLPSTRTVGEPRNWLASASSGVVISRCSTVRPRAAARCCRRSSATFQFGQPSKYSSSSFTGRFSRQLARRSNPLRGAGRPGGRKTPDATERRPRAFGAARSWRASLAGPRPSSTVCLHTQGVARSNPVRPALRRTENAPASAGAFSALSWSGSAPGHPMTGFRTSLTGSRTNVTESQGHSVAVHISCSRTCSRSWGRRDSYRPGSSGRHRSCTWAHRRRGPRPAPQVPGARPALPRPRECRR